jgi:HK97 family phage major capsid protein
MSGSLKEYFKGEASRKLAEAAHIADRASGESRGMSPDERTKSEALIAEAHGHLDRVKGLEENERITETIDEMTGSLNKPAEQAPDGVRSLGDAFVKSDGYRALADGFKAGRLSGNWSTGAIELADFGTKATVTETASPIANPRDLPGFTQAAAVALRRLTVADLMMQGTTDGASVRYMLETTNTNAAATVAEGAAKPESTITFTQVTEDVRKVATFLPVSDEMLEDVAQIRSYLDSRLRLFVQHAEEAQLLAGDGTAPNISGILDRTGLQTNTRAALGTITGETAAASTIANAVYQAITEIRTDAMAEPDGIVMHPNNWVKARLAKDANGQYVGGGPMVGQNGGELVLTETYWGLPVAVTAAITENTALVGAFGSMSQVFYRGGLTVEASNSHSDFFQKNLTAIRAERRLALAVYRPAAFFSITAMQTA